MSCSRSARECMSCHRPLPERFYSERVDQCDSCVRRRQRYEARQVNQTGGGQSSALPNESNNVDILQFLADEQFNVETILHDFLHEKKGMKWFLTLKLKFIKYDENNESHLAEPVLRSKHFWMTNLAEINEQLAEAFQHLYASSQEFQAEGSGWILEGIIQLEVNTAEYVPLSASSYIPLSKYLADKKALMNIHNNDQKCFMWSVLAALHPLDRKQHPERVGKYLSFLSELNLQGIDFPIPLSHIPKFENQNQISVNVYGYEEQVFPLHISKQKFDKTVDLLLLSEGEKRHFCLIRNFSRLMGDRTKHKAAAFYCRRCLHGFSRQDLLKDHSLYCSEHNPQKVKLPNEYNKWIRFESIQNQLKVPFVIYADFEALTRKVNDKSRNTSLHQKHEPSGYCYKVISSNPELTKPSVVYRGPDVISHFIEALLQEEKAINEKLQKSFPIDMTKETELKFQMANICHICEEPFHSSSIKVRDHDHLVERNNYRGAAHQNCNLQLKLKKSKSKGKKMDQGKMTEGKDCFIPIIFHNLRGYDSHLLMRQLDNTVKQKLCCLANNIEKYISFSIGKLRFIDSLQFLSNSLDTLVKNLVKKDPSQFIHLRQEFPNSSQVDLLLKKGVYPYGHMDDESKFELTRLPKQTDFFSRLTGNSLSDEDYTHAKNVWSAFELQNMGEYHDLYVKTDVLLLADVFESFRTMALEYYHLDPAHYYTLPGMGWDAMLKMGKVELERLTDIDQILMLESGMRGGISMISKKHSLSNLPGQEDYKPDEANKHLIYWDANNLYGWAMSQALPERDFEWVEDVDDLDIMGVAPNADIGYILEVDLEYPSHLHDAHSDYPLAPESMIVTEDMLSEHSRELKKNLKIKGKPSRKLVPNLFNKQKYVLHYRNLQFYLSHGMVLSKIHRAIQFKQTSWLEPFITFNTEKRRESTNKTDKAFFKLMNNSCFGRSMMNVRKHVSVELVNTAKRLRKLCAKPTFEAFKIFNPDLAAVHLKKDTLFLNQPVYAGFSILDLSKVHMYNFHYNFIKPNYGQKAQLCFTDTDSPCYEIETPDLYADMGRHSDLFDTSNYAKDHPLFSQKNENVLGKFKDELQGKNLLEFLGLRPKMYSMFYKETETKTVKVEKVIIVHDIEKKTAKGITETVRDKHLRHALYKQCLFDQKQFRHEVGQIQSKNHQLYTASINKISLSPFDDKRYVLTDGISTLAHGHCRIKSQ
ncbi:uncharacterized protein LOC124257474 [Haliotis rubra]|uniref:uncharacterized protein LOC124257474 n=1 Tax=Haliotis rubra TaxID=36100 RepID=UPI001EE5DA21|nr:uncharacterized protein LOC124257474 [Haliotis rubra]